MLFAHLFQISFRIISILDVPLLMPILEQEYFLEACLFSNKSLVHWNLKT